MTPSAAGTKRRGAAADRAAGASGAAGTGGVAGAGSPKPGRPSGQARPLVLTGAIAAGAAAGTGLVTLIMLVLAGWIAAPHAGLGLTGVLRTAAAIWLVGHHVGFTLHGAGRIGMLPLGLVLLPGALLWRSPARRGSPRRRHRRR